MGESSPDLELTDAIEDDMSEELASSLMDFDDTSEISSIVKTAAAVGSAQWTLARSDDDDAPEVTCTLSGGDDALDAVMARESRSVGHGLRPVVEPRKGEIHRGPRVVVRRDDD